MTNFIKIRLVQIAVLSYKSLLTNLRSWKLLLAKLFLPLFVLLGFWLFVTLIPSGEDKTPESTNFLGGIPRCTDFNGVDSNNCTTLFYSPNTTQIYTLMSLLATQSALIMDTDIKYTPLTIDGLLNYTLEYPNTTQSAIFFELSPTSGNLTFPDVKYSLLYNNSRLCSLFGTECVEPTNILFQLQLAIDKTILNYYYQEIVNEENVNEDFVNLQLRFKPYPTLPTNSTANFINTMLILFIYISIFLPFVFLFFEIAKEKADGLKGYMKVMGLCDFSYFLQITIDHAIFYTIPAILIILFGNILQIEFFTLCDFSVLFIFTLSFNFAQLSISLFLLSLIKNIKIAILASFGLLMISIMISSMISAFDYLAFSFWNPSFISDYGPWYFLSIIPYFSFSIGLLNIKLRTMGSAFLPSSQDTTLLGVTWSGLFENPIAYTTDGIEYAPTLIYNMYWMIGVGGVLFILGIYFDNILPTEDRAHAPFYYFLTPSYWGFCSPQIPINNSKNENNSSNIIEKESKKELNNIIKSPLIINENNIDDEENDEDLNQEKNDVNNNHLKIELKIKNLVKKYTNYSLSIWRSDWKFKKSQSALDGLYLTAKEGQTLCVLGQNGAGKTTAFKILTGVTSSSSGEATIYGLSCKTHMSQIRSMIGVCPQFDILWENLTSKEHLMILGGIKTGRFFSSDEVEAILNDVRLLHAKNKVTNGYSGGMKRSLSVAISTIGNPRVIFLDEPTTGMDPSTRRYIWNLITRLKKERLVIITTHSMEEADVLGDKVAIMAKGKLRAVGSSFHLKSRFGTSYRLTLVTERWRVRDAMAKIKEIMPEAVVQDYGGNVAGSLVYLIPKEGLADVEKSALLFDYLQNATYFDGVGQTKVILQWGISNVTLEDVFMCVAKKYLNYDDLLS